MSTLTVAVIQHDISWLDAEKNFAQLEGVLDTFDFQSVDLLILPETFSTGFAIKEKEAVVSSDDALSFLMRLAKSKGFVVCGSVLIQGDGKKHNRFYWCWPDGQVQFYDKRHLFRLGKEGEFVHAGEKRVILSLNGFRILPQVCYDLRFPVFQRNRQDYDVMVNVANWPAVRRSAWDTLLRARAIENQAFVIGCNRVGSDGYGTAHSGGSVVLSPSGEVISSAHDNQVDVIITHLDKSDLESARQAFPVHLDADDFQLS